MKKQRTSIKKQNWKENHSNFIYIPHLGYWVLYGVSSKEFSGRQEKSFMFTENTSKDTVSIIFRKKPTPIQSGTVAHEVLHALQFICRRRNITMEEETEHMGYLMQYIFNEIYDKVYDTTHTAESFFANLK